MICACLVSIKCFRESCGLRKVWYDTNECFVATLGGQLIVTRVTRRVLLMEHELLAHSEHPRWSLFFIGVRVVQCLVFMCCCPFILFRFVILLTVLITFSIFKLLLCIVLDDSFFHSLFLLYHSNTDTFFPVQPITSIFYYLSVCSRRDYSYIAVHVPLGINQCI